MLTQTKKASPTSQTNQKNQQKEKSEKRHPTPLPSVQKTNNTNTQHKNNIDSVNTSHTVVKAYVNSCSTTHVNKKPSTIKNSLLIQYLTKVNKYPRTKIEKRLFRLREKTQKSLNFTHTPNPLKTTNVIYCIYSDKRSVKKLYIGQTSGTAYNRLQQHCHNTDHTPIHRYIQKNGPENFKVFALQKIRKNEKPETLEQNWIKKLQTQVNEKNPNNLNHIQQLKLTRKSKKTFPKPQTKTPSVPIQTKRIHGNTIEIAPQRMYKSRDYTYRITILHNAYINQTIYQQQMKSLKKQKQKNKEDEPNRKIEPEFLLKSYSNKTLRMLASVISNKKIIPHKPKNNSKPTIFLQYFEKPNRKITKHNKSIKKLIPTKTLKRILKDILTQLHANIKPAIKHKTMKFPIPITHVHSAKSQKILQTIVNNAQNLLPYHLQNNLHIATISRNIPAMGTHFYNYK